MNLPVPPPVMESLVAVHRQGMTITASRQPKGVPSGGQFATTAHHEPDAALVDPESHQAALAETGVAARTGLGHSSATHIAVLMRNSPAAVYDENAATLAAANACTIDDIHSIDRVFNSGERPLRLNGPGDDLTDALTAAGLAGQLAPYTGDNPDITAGAWAYTSDSGRELVVGRTDDGGFGVYHEDSQGDGSFSVETPPDHATPASNVADIKDALWDLAVADANYSTPTGLRSGDYYELREISLSHSTEDGACAMVLASNDDGMWTTLTHDYPTGTTTVHRDGTILDGAAAELEIAAVFEGLGSEPDNGDFQAHAKTVFGNLLAESGQDPDAPRWASQLSRQKGTP